MEGLISSFRRSRKKTSKNQMIILVDDVTTKEQAEKLVGKVVTWKSPGDKELKGKISAIHGGKGAVRSIFETGMPGQAIGTKVIIA